MSCDNVIKLPNDSGEITISSNSEDELCRVTFEPMKNNFETLLSSPLQEQSVSESEDDSFVGSPIIGSQKLYDISSSDEDFAVSTQTDVDSRLPLNFSSDSCEGKDAGSHSLSSSSTQSIYAGETASNSKKHEGSMCKAPKQLKTEKKQRQIKENFAEKEKQCFKRKLAKEEKRKEREEKQNIARVKLAEKRQAAFILNQMKPSECIKFMKLVVDEKLFITRLFGQVVEIFPHPAVAFLHKNLPLENSITWTRSQLDGSSCEEGWVAVMWPADDVAAAISNSSLVSQFKQISTNIYPNKKIILLIFAMDLYHRKYDNNKSYISRKAAGRDGETLNSQLAPPLNKYLSRAEIEWGLLEVQIHIGVSHRHFSSSAELADILGQFTRAIAEIPYRLEKEKVDKEMGWYARSSSKNCVRANNDMQGLDRLWLQHLTVFSNSNIDTAKAIALLYPTPTTLIEAYENCDSQREKEHLLEDIQVKRSGSSSAASRRLGPELSKKICLTFTQTDGNFKLSNKV